MTRLRRFEEHRFVGTRDDMVVYDTDDPDHVAVLAGRVADDQLIERNLIQTFGPDEVAEARSRGFAAPPVTG